MSAGSNMWSNQKDVKPLLNTSASLLFSIAITLSCSIIFHAQDIFHFLYPSKPTTTEYIYPTYALMLSFICVCGTYIYGTFLLTAKKLRELNKLYFAGFILNVGLNLYGIPKYGATGAAITTLITQFFILIVQFIWVYRMGLVKNELIQKLGLYVLVYSLTLYGIHLINLSSWMLSFILSCLIGGFISLVIGLISIRSMHSILSQKIN